MADVTIDDYTLRNALYGAARDCGTTAFKHGNFERQHHHIGDDTGRLALAALRSLGSYDAMAVVIEYLASINRHLDHDGKAPIPLAAVLRSLPRALPDASEDEVETIRRALEGNAEDYWGAPL